MCQFCEKTKADNQAEAFRKIVLNQHLNLIDALSKASKDFDPILGKQKVIEIVHEVTQTSAIAESDAYSIFSGGKKSDEEKPQEEIKEVGIEKGQISLTEDLKLLLAEAYAGEFGDWSNTKYFAPKVELVNKFEELIKNVKTGKYG